MRSLGREERKKRLNKIGELFGKAREYTDDKVQIAMQMYEMVRDVYRILGKCLWLYISKGSGVWMCM